MSQPPDNGQPLGLPRGSIRALLALMIVATALYIVATTGNLPEILIGLVGVVVGWYFGSRGANGIK